MENKTAILVFANSAGEETKHKSIPGGKALFHELTKHTLTLVKKTYLPYFHCNEQQQNGTSFGERFYNAIRTIFEAGYHHVITIGNDTPQLTASHILSAHAHLINKKTVLGPSLDGGYYLMGFNRTLFLDLDKKEFIDLPWKRTSLQLSITHLLQTKLRETIKLETLSDLDNLKDLKTLAKHRIAIPQDIIKIINGILKILTKIIRYTPKLNAIYYTSNYFNKGSPIFVYPRANQYNIFRL